MEGVSAWKHVKSLSQQSCLTYLTPRICFNGHTSEEWGVVMELLTQVGVQHVAMLLTCF